MKDTSYFSLYKCPKYQPISCIPNHIKFAIENVAELHTYLTEKTLSLKSINHERWGFKDLWVYVH